MTDYTDLSDIRVDGRISSKVQGSMVGSMKALPEPREDLLDLAVLYSGESTAEYTNGAIYICRAYDGGFRWEVTANLAVDPVPAEGSANPVSSGGVYDALQGKQDAGDYATVSELEAGLATKQDSLVFDDAPQEGGTNPVTSGGIFAAMRNESDTRSEADTDIRGEIADEVAAREAADTEIRGVIANEEAARVAADEAMESRIEQEAADRASEDEVIRAAIADERSARESSDNDLQSQIDAAVASSDVKDIVGTYQELQSYDTSTLHDNDIVKVLSDSTKEGASTYYRWVIAGGAGSWSYIGSEGPYYTISEADDLLNAKANVADVYTKADTYSKTEADAKLAQKQIKLIPGTGISLDASGNISATGQIDAYTKTEVDNKLDAKQNRLISGTNIKTINSQSLVGSGNIEVSNITVDSAMSSSSPNPVRNSTIYSALNNKQDKLTASTGISISGSVISTNCDSTPVSGSSKPLSSGGAYTALNAKQAKLTAGTGINISSSNVISSTAGGEYTLSQGSTNVVQLKKDGTTASTIQTYCPELIKVDIGRTEGLTTAYFSRSYSTPPFVVFAPFRNSTSAPSKPMFIKEITKKYCIIGTYESGYDYCYLAVFDSSLSS